MEIKELFAQGMVKVKENDHTGAITIFSKVLELDPKNANALSQRAVAYLNLEQYELSMFDMNQAIEYDPEYSYRYQCRGYLKARLNDHHGAIEDYQKAVELDPNDSIAHNNLALAQEQLGWAKQAQQNFDKSDKLAGIKTAEERAEARKQQHQSAQQTTKKTTDIFKTTEAEEETSSKSEIAKSVFTKKSVFKEFISFIRNGFKLKDNDQS